MRVTEAQALRITIAYADIFDYPMSDEELRYWCVYRVLSKRYVHRSTKRPAIRHRRAAYSARKWKIAGSLWWLRLLPTIECIGVTGALAMNNADLHDDIDFLIITKSGTLWTTRLMTTFLLDLFNLRRRPGDRKFRDKICLNMFITSDALAVPKSEQDLFTAHEVLQMKPLWDRGNTYGQFLYANSWVRKFLPTAWASKVKGSTFIIRRSALSFLEPAARALQLWYMRNRRTTEVVSDTVIRFHPVDARDWIYRALRVRLRGTNIPLDKIFYGR